MKLSEVKHAAGALNLNQLIKLEAWLRSVIETAEGVGDGKSAAKRPHAHKTYQQEMVRCGKKGCKCAEGQLHGPYWYAYWSEGGKVRSQYIGKRLPRSVKPQRSAKSRGVR